MTNKENTKNITIILLACIIICLFIIGGYLSIAYTNKETNQNNSNETPDITEKALKHNLLDSIYIQNSLKQQCNWDNITFNWEFPEQKELKIYKTLISEIELNDIESDMKSSTEEAVKDFYDNHSEINNLKYDYLTQIYSDYQNTYEKTPLYKELNGFKIYTSTLAVWRTNNEEFIAGLYEVENNYNDYQFNEDDYYFSFTAKSEEEIKQDILNSNINFLNHEYLCENSNITCTDISSIEIVYINWGEYMIPVYQIIGSFDLDDNTIKWTALINSIDFTKFDYTIYIDKETNKIFIPKPYISEIKTDKDKCYISGYLANTIHYINDNTNQIADSIQTYFTANEETGEYIYGERKEILQEEINNSLEVNRNNQFTFSFSVDNFWKVEELIHIEGNKSDTTHSPEKEIIRSKYDNWFKIKVCSTFDDTEYCSEYSDTNYLEHINK